MTSDHGWVEPVDAGEPAAQHDALEHWLHGIRTGLADIPADWLAGTSDDAEAPLDAKAPPTYDDGGTTPQPRGAQTTGRHRAGD